MKPQEANQTIIVILIFSYFYAILVPIIILIVSITIGVSIKITMRITVRITTGITKRTGIRILLSVGIATRRCGDRKTTI
jgi:hypothetical protein